MKEFIEKLMGRLEKHVAYNEKMFEMFPNMGEVEKTIYNTQKNSYEETIRIVNQLAEEYKQCIKSSCSNCETYDKEKHYCPKWCDVIKGTVAEMDENRWIPCSERLPEKNAIVLTCDKDGWISVKVNMPYAGAKNDFECGYYTAWMPLPPAYVPKEGRE